MIDSHPEFAGLTDAVWADADAEHAASQLAEIAVSAELAKARAARAKDYLLRYLADRTYGKALVRLGSRNRARTT